MPIYKLMKSPDGTHYTGYATYIHPDYPIETDEMEFDDEKAMLAFIEAQRPAPEDKAEADQPPPETDKTAP